MKTFHVYTHPDGRLEAVKDGFSFPGAFFGGFWLLWHKMWLIGSIAIIVGSMLYIVFPSPAGYIMGIPYGHKFGLPDILNVSIQAIVGFFGNEWRMSSLQERGFEHVSDEIAETPDGAKAEYLRNPNKPFLMGIR